MVPTAKSTPSEALVAWLPALENTQNFFVTLLKQNGVHAHGWNVLEVPYVRLHWRFCLLPHEPQFFSYTSFNNTPTVFVANLAGCSRRSAR